MQKDKMLTNEACILICKNYLLTLYESVSNRIFSGSNFSAILILMITGSSQTFSIERSRTVANERTRARLVYTRAKSQRLTEFNEPDQRSDHSVPKQNVPLWRPVPARFPYNPNINYAYALSYYKENNSQNNSQLTSPAGQFWKMVSAPSFISITCNVKNKFGL